jgi:hypothetical protein
MNCQRFENVVSDLVRGQMMEVDVRTDALAHVDECDECHMRLRDEEMLTRGLRGLAGEMESLEAPARIESQLRQAFRDRHAVAPVVPIASKRSSNYRYWLTAAAAVLLLVLGVVAVQFRRTPSQTTATQTEKSEPQKVVPNEPVEVPGKDENKLADNQQPRKTVRPRPVKLASNPRPAKEQVAHHAEVATEFMPIGYMSAASLQDGGQIVRVELPRSRLASFGFIVNMERYNEKVKADVLLGVDGMAQAIRFVQ